MLTRRFEKDWFVNTTVYAVFTGNKGTEPEKINKNHSENNQFIINNSSSSEQALSAFRVKRNRKPSIYQFTGVFNGHSSHRTCMRHKTTLKSHLEPSRF